MKSNKNKVKNHEILQELIVEVTKESRNQTKVKDLTKKIGIPFVTDSVEQMSLILQYCDQRQAREGQSLL